VDSIHSPDRRLFTVEEKFGVELLDSRARSHHARAVGTLTPICSSAARQSAGPIQRHADAANRLLALVLPKSRGTRLLRSGENSLRSPFLGVIGARRMAWQPGAIFASPEGWLSGLQHWEGPDRAGRVSVRVRFDPSRWSQVALTGSIA